MAIKISGSTIINDARTVQNYGITHNVLGSVSGTTPIDLQSGNYVSATITGTTTFTFTNPLPQPHACGFVMEVINGGNFAVIWPNNVGWSRGQPPVLTENGTDILVFLTDDGGTNWTGNLSIKDRKVAE
jgi:hypothetical protein